MATDRPRTLGELKQSGHRLESVKDEMRRNLIALIRRGEPLFPEILGYEETVVPQVQNAILSKHDMLFLGTRGQAKTRMLRQLARLLDDAVPVVDGSEVNDHPYHPVSREARDKLESMGEDTPIAWVGREQRYQEKLATPDVTIADLIGEIDMIKHAEGRYLSSELTMHFGLIPRTNRGIFCMNELPDLSPKIQVGLFNVLEERDVQIRGYQIRLPLDLLLVATANPEDYTHRGRIVSPLKDRFGTQVRTHYPESLAEEIRSMDQEARAAAGRDRLVARVPAFMKEVLAALTAELRSPPQINQRSGVSVRYSIGNLETLTAAALRRAARSGEPEAVPRVVDLPAVLAGSLGRVEFDAVEEGREEEILLRATRQALLEVFRKRLAGFDFAPLLDRFGEDFSAETSEVTPAGDFLAQFGDVPGLAKLLGRLGIEEESPGLAASALEFALEGLHLSRRLNKDAAGRVGAFRYEGLERR